MALISISLDIVPQNQITFDITSPNADSCGAGQFQGCDLPVKIAVCHTKTTTQLTGANFLGLSETIIEDNSPFLTDNPQFIIPLNSVTEPNSGKEVLYVKHELKIRCEAVFSLAGENTPDADHTFSTAINQLNCEDPDKSEECIKTTKLIDIFPSQMEVHVYAQDSEGVKSKIKQTTYDTERVVLNGGSEKVLLSVVTPIDVLTENLQAGNYNSNFEFRTSGVLQMLIEDLSISGDGLTQVHYYIGQTDIPTFFTLKITADEDDPEPTPKCPIEGQTWNTVNKRCEVIPDEGDDCMDKEIFNKNSGTCEPDPDPEPTPDPPGLECNDGEVAIPFDSDGDGTIGEFEAKCVPEKEADPGKCVSETFDDKGACIDDKPTFLDEVMVCLDSSDPVDCLNDQKFILLWGAGFLIIFIIIIAIIASLFKPASPYR